MTARLITGVLVAFLATTVSAFGQVPRQGPDSRKYVDPVDGLSLEQAIARALEQEPSLRAERSTIDVARGMRLQASLRPNPSVSFERREEPAGTDNQTTVSVEWPLDLFRRERRVAVADREVTTVQAAVADRERLLGAEVRTRYGDVVAAIREMAILDELVTVARQQYEVLHSRVDEGAAPPIDRDLIDAERRRREAERLLLAGRTEAALVELKRSLGMKADAPLAVSDTLEEIVRRESSAAVAAPASADAPDPPDPLDRRPDVREAAARVDVAAAKIDRARTGGRLDVSLFANYMRMDAGFPQRGFTPAGNLERIQGLFNYVSAGATITVPWLNRNQGDVAAARAERAGAESAYQAALLTANAELTAARTRDDHARLAVNAYSGGQTLARQNLAVVAQSYELGRVSVFDVLAEQRRYLDAERGYTDALRAAYEARTALNRAIGGVQ